jgi:hypothetical protein
MTRIYDFFSGEWSFMVPHHGLRSLALTISNFDLSVSAIRLALSMQMTQSSGNTWVIESPEP